MSHSATDRCIGHLGPSLALQPRTRLRKYAVLIVDGTPVPTRDHTVAEQPKNHRYSTNPEVVIDADSRLIVDLGRPVPGNRHDRTAWEASGAKSAVGRTTVIADGDGRGTGLAIPDAHLRKAVGVQESRVWLTTRCRTWLGGTRWEWPPGSSSRRMLSRDRTRCPRCPASRCTTHCGRPQAAVARVSRRVRPAARIRLRAWRGALHPRARCRPAHQDAADS